VNIFFDTSALIKLYFKEAGSERLDDIFSQYAVQNVFLSELAITEFYSAIYKKIRVGAITEINAYDILSSFTADKAKFIFLPLNSAVSEISISLIKKYGLKGLRTLDALQFATILANINLLDGIVSDDKLLNIFLSSEGINLL
jgi:uncharacterized protein